MKKNSGLEPVRQLVTVCSHGWSKFFSIDARAGD
jgi:hypothetical protein